MTAREQILGHSAAVVWLTGLSGSGKSTLAYALERHLLAEGILTVVLDGDVMRSTVCRGLGLTEADRHENVRRITEVALCCARAGLVAIVSCIAPYMVDRAEAVAKTIQCDIPFAEVYVDCPLEVCRERDPKGLYRRHGSQMTGAGSAPYEPPLHPTLHLQTGIENPVESLDRLVAHVHGLIQNTPALV